MTDGHELGMDLTREDRQIRVYQERAIPLCSELESILFTPFLHDLDEVFYLRVRGVLEHVDDIDESLLLLNTGDHELEDTNCGTTLPLPELWVSIKTLQHVKRFRREVELAHLVAVVGDQVQQGQTFIGCLHIDVDVPGEVRLLVHDVGATKPGKITIVLLVSLVLNGQQRLLCLLKLASRCRGDTIVPIKVVVVDVVRPDRLEVDKHVVELLQDEEAASHALATGDSVALRGRRTDHLEEVLRDAHMILLIRLLADEGVHYGL